METLIEKNGYVKYLIETEENKETSLVFKIYQAMAWDKNNKPCEVEEYISGRIKWDGCSHLYFGDKEGYMHLCGREFFDDMKDVLDAVWNKAKEEIKEFNKDIAE